MGGWSVTDGAPAGDRRGTQLTLKHSRRRRGSWRAGFTLLEVILATVMAAMVTLGALGLFATLDRSQKRHAVRMERALEMATARAAMQRAFSSLLMNEGTEPKEEELKKLRDEDRRKAEQDLAGELDDDAIEARFALQPADVSMGGSMVGGSMEGRPAQMFMVCLRAAPIAGRSGTDGGESGLLIVDESGRLLSEEEAGAYGGHSKVVTGLSGIAARRQQRVSDRAGVPVSGTSSVTDATQVGKFESTDARSGKRGTTTAGGGGGGGGGSGGSAKPQSETSGSEGGSTGRTIAGLENLTSAPRAPGVRGVFEIMPDEQDARSRGGEGGVGLAVWWREMPTIVVPSAGEQGLDQDDAATQAALVRRMRFMGVGGTAGKRVKLLGGLKSAEWRVLRSDRLDTKMSAVWAGQLPAHVEFSFETLEGQREDWMFEVAWSTGQEPGGAVSGGSSAVLSGPRTTPTSPTPPPKNRKDGK